MKIAEILVNSMKLKIMPIWTKVKRFTNTDYLKNEAGVKVRERLLNNFHIRPKDAKDYYPVGKWLVSKRLAMVLVLAAVVLSLTYIWIMKPENLFRGKDGYQCYKYNALPLKFYNGTVKILGKSGYTAYIGEVKKGKVQGNGTLYNLNGEMVYQGEFSDNRYHGAGTLNYPGNLLKYQGEFQDNEFSGEGCLYRKNGTMEYQGAFEYGMKQGMGELFNQMEEPVYNGLFQSDEIVYQALVGKPTSKASKMYTGRRKIYTYQNDICVSMPEINALYWGKEEQGVLEENVSVSGVYVLNSVFYSNRKKYENIKELNGYFGKAVYQGHTSITAMDAAALNQLEKIEESFGNYVEIVSSPAFVDVINIEEFDDQYPLYITAYTQEGFRYTFFSAEKSQQFFFYLIEKEE